MTAPISESWARVENWLAEHAPVTRAALAPPADPADIAATERVIGRPLPKPLVMSLLRHDGLLDGWSALLPGFYSLLSARRTAAEWKIVSGFYDRITADEEGDEVDDDFVKTGFSSILYGHPRLIPIAREVGGGYLVLDDRPEADRGRVHEAEATDGVTRGGHGMWASLPVLMESVATSLETGRPVNGYRPEVNEEQRLRWDLPPLRGEGTVRRP
ncbi:SMI1/KNR4 family protein [Streptomyces sp. NPDC006267]|uniref:SMI1/KNR4 family protein n=1 Tax=Streptomyces sp. NPDC006267 TaxID=3157173 RepID=UPI0033B6F09D